MTENLLIAIVSSAATAGSTTLVAMTAIVQNNKRFDAIECTLGSMQADLKEFYKELSRHSTDIELLKKEHS